MTTAAPSAALVTIQPAFTDPERLALAGFLAGYRGLTREAYALDLRQFTTWCRAPHHRKTTEASRVSEDLLSILPAHMRAGCDRRASRVRAYRKIVLDGDPRSAWPCRSRRGVSVCVHERGARTGVRAVRVVFRRTAGWVRF